MPLTRIQHGFFFALLMVTTVAFFWVSEAFLQPVFWAAVFAILFRPVFRWWRRVLDGRVSMASTLALLTIVFIVIIPLFFVGLAVAQEATALYERIASGEIDVRAAVRWVEQQVPLVASNLERIGVDVAGLQQDLSNAAVAVSQALASRAWAFGQDTLWFTVLLFLMLYFLFFFLRDGTKIMDAIIRALPLGNERERRLFAKFAEVSRATMKGTLVVGVVQGTLGGLIFWILGIGAPVFWGVIMTILSLLPAVGSAIVWVPAAVILAATGEVGRAVVLVVVGTLIIGLVDNILRPILVGRDTRMPDYLVLLSTLGGIAAVGISGFVIGPVIAALFLTVWDMFAEEYSMQVDPQGAEGTRSVREAAGAPEAVDDELGAGVGAGEAARHEEPAA